MLPTSVLFSLIMGKGCCTVGYTRRYFKGCGFQFYRFPRDSERRSKWIAAVKRKDWQPTEYSWICSSHFVGGKKSNDPQSPAYIPSLFHHVQSPVKRAAERNLVRYSRVMESKRRRIQAAERERHEAEKREQCEERKRHEAEARQNCYCLCCFV